MTQEPTVHPFPARWLRSLAERVATERTRERVLFPLLADLQFEHARTQGRWARVVVRARGTLSFWRAFGITALLDSGRHLLAHSWGTTEEEARAAKRLFARVGVGVLAVSVLLLGREYPRLRHLNAGGTVLLLAPSILAVAIPVGLLFALALGTARAAVLGPGTPWRVGAVAGLVTFAISSWVTPVGNQAFRQRVYEVVSPGSAGPLTRGDREMTLDALAAHATTLRVEGRVKEAARFEVEWHKKPALAALCLVFVLAGAAIGSSGWGTLGRGFAAFLVAWMAHALFGVGEQAADAGRVSPALAMWRPIVVMGAVGLALTGLARRAIEGTPASGSAKS